MLVITAVENGIHSLAKGLEAFAQFHEDHTDKFALKDAIIRSHHAIETLLKAVLYEHNPVLLLPEDSVNLKRFMDAYPRGRSGESSYLEGQYTIGIEECLKRLKRIGQLQNFENREFERLCYGLRKLAELRNNLQHFGIEVRIDEVGHVLGITIPRFTALLNHLASQAMVRREFYSSMPSYGSLEATHIRLFRWLITVEEIFPGGERVIELLASQYDRELVEAAELLTRLRLPDLPLEIFIHFDEYFAKAARSCEPPGIRLSGFINADFSSAPESYYNPDAMFHESRIDRVGKTLPFYHASLDVTVTGLAPDLPNRDDFIAAGSLSTISGTVLYHGTIRTERPSDYLNLPSGETAIRLLRGTEITIEASARYDALWSTRLRAVHEILLLDGQVCVEIKAVPQGVFSSERDYALVGRVSLPVNTTTSTLSIRDSVSQPASSDLKTDWHIVGIAHLEFEDSGTKMR
jgi:hypothetical protein